MTLGQIDVWLVLAWAFLICGALLVVGIAWYGIIRPWLVQRRSDKVSPAWHAEQRKRDFAKARPEEFYRPRKDT